MVPSMFSRPPTGALVALLHWDAVLRQSNGGCHPERPEPQRPGLVRSSDAGGLARGLAHHVPSG